MKMPAAGLVSRHLFHLATRPALPFILRAGLGSVAVSLIVVASAIWLRPSLEDYPNEIERVSFLSLVVIAPFIETLVFQWFPVWLTRLFTQRFRTTLLVAWIPFALTHFFNNPLSGISVLAGGYYIGFTYAIWVRRSTGKAILVTSAVHAFNNLVAWVLIKFT